MVPMRGVWLCGLLRLKSLAIAAALFLTCLPVLPSTDTEFIRVAPDHWGFETSDTKTRFIPFGRTSC